MSRGLKNGRTNPDFMLRSRLILFFSLAFFLTGCGNSNNDFPPIVDNGPTWTAPDPATLSVRLQKIVDDNLAESDTPGALVGVFTPNGNWTSATGFADVEGQRPISFNDVSAWRSITKSLTVTVVMQLVAEGDLDLDAPVGDYVNGVPNGSNITLRQLAAMRSGLFNYTKDLDFQQAFAADLDAEWTDAELLGYAFDHPVNFPAGTKYEYSNTNTILLGVVAETVTGRSLKQLIGERLLTPLNLNNSTYLESSLFPSPFARGYFFDEGEFVAVTSNGTALSGSGAMVGTLANLSTWGTALVRGNLLPASLQQQRFQGGPTDGGPIYDSYGLGMGEIRGWWGHTGVGIGYECCVFTEPTTGSQIVILLNASNANQDVPFKMSDEILDALGWIR